ncbi:MAG: dipeptidase [Pseudomonadota bacterium]
MIKRIGLLLAGALALLVTVFLARGPEIADGMINRVEPPSEALVITDESRALHQTLTVIDLHADPLLVRRNFTERLDYGHTDLPRLEEGNVAIQVFASVTKSPAGLNYDSNPSDSDTLTTLVIAQLQPLRTWTSLLERALFHAQRLEQYVADAPDRLAIVRSVSDIDTLLASRTSTGKPVGGLLAIEGAQSLEGRLDSLDTLFDAGYRMIGTAHFFDNKVSGSMHGEEKYGLPELGVRVIRRAEELGMVIDLAHASAATVDDILNIVTTPVVVSHGGVRGTCDTNRNLYDDQIERIAQIGGVIAIGYWDAAVCDTSPAGIVDAMDYIRDLVGVEHVGLGSDYDGAIVPQFDTSQLALITGELMQRGYSVEDIARIMGGNVLEIFRSVLPAR